MQLFCNFLLVIIIFCISKNIYAGDLQKKDHESLILKADFIKYDNDLNSITANGNIYLYMDKYILTADNIYYDIKKDVVFAEGNIRIKDEVGRIITGQRAVLKDKLKKAVIDEFMLRLPDDSLLMSAYANKQDENRVNLHKANFTPCKIFCGNKSIWQIKSEDTNIDYEKQQITYKNMFFEVFGVPVFYLPFFFHSTPNASAKSGILVPQIAQNKLVLPLYYRVKSNIDLTLSPHISKKYTIFEGELRHLITYGSYEVKASYANKSDKTSQKYIKPHRYIIFTKGNFYKDGINYGFDINRASDKAYLVNEFENYDSYLESKIYVNKFAKTDYLSLEGYSFQGFKNVDTNSKHPIVFPRIIVQKVIALDDDENTLFKVKNNSILYNENYEKQIARNALELNLSRKIITNNGHLFNFAIENRSDLYWLNSLNDFNKVEEEHVLSRNIPEIHAKWRYPLVRNISSTTSIKLEPIFAAFIGTSYDKNYNKFALIDASKYEISEYNLFNSDKFRGIDYHDYGKRFSYGLNTSLFSGLYYVDVFLGQLLYYNNIVANSNSDYVGNISIDIADNLKLYYRFRKDKKLNHIMDEVGLSSKVEKLTTSLNFSELNNISRYYSEDISNFPKNKAAQIGLNVNYQIFESLAIGMGALLDTTDKVLLLQRTIEMTYVFDCVSISVKFYDDFTNDSTRGVKKNNSKTFAIGLKVLNM